MSYGIMNRVLLHRNTWSILMCANNGYKQIKSWFKTKGNAKIYIYM